MSNKRSLHLTVFEHETVHIDKGEKRLTESQFMALQRHYGEGVPYYELTYRGVRFNEYVGVINVGNTLIEVLPKADRNTERGIGETKWRQILIAMLNSVGSLDIKSSSQSDLKIKPNSILDLYFEMFIREVEYLLHNGLVKKYRKKEGNVLALKGNLQFGKHLQQNITHQERFYVNFTSYDLEHQLHYIIYKTIKLLNQINSNSKLHGRIGRLLLNFPEMPDVKVTESTFAKLSFTRKTSIYSKAIDIAKLLLLKYHPDLTRGQHNVLALMFDMNRLWEEFVFASLRKHRTAGMTLTSQTSKFFWRPLQGNRSKIKPDIVVTMSDGKCIVMDTKWKNLNGYNPSADDLRQMYVYHEYFNAQKVALIYPGSEPSESSGTYLHPSTNQPTQKICSVISLCVENEITLWQKNIYNTFERWINSI